MIDIEPISVILYNYHLGYVLSQDEMDMLRDWRAESPAHEKFFQEINHNAYPGGAEDLQNQIRCRLLKMEEWGE